MYFIEVNIMINLNLKFNILVFSSLFLLPFFLITSPADAKSIDNASFISQSVSSSLTTGQTVTVSVTMKNTGTTTWTANAGYVLGSQSPQDNIQWGVGRVLLSAVDQVDPGQSKTFTFQIKAPAQAGNYNFQWQMLQENVQWFGEYTAVVPVAVNPVAPVNDAAFVSQSVFGTYTTGQTATVSVSVFGTYTTGQTATVSVTMKNTGTTTWTASAGYALGAQNPQDNIQWGAARVFLSSSDQVNPGQSKTFTFQIKAPAQAGDYNFQWRMLQENVQWFGNSTPNVYVSVASVPVASEPVPTTGSTNNAVYVSQSVGSAYKPGQIATVSVTMRNTGTSTWTASAGYVLGSQYPKDNVIWGIGRALLSSTDQIAPGQSKTFTFQIKAPAQAGSYNFQWRMLREDVEWFGDLTAAAVTVVSQSSTTQYVCSSLISFNNSSNDASGALQNCINQTQSNQILAIPPGTYTVNKQILINKPIAMTTQGKNTTMPPCNLNNTTGCAEIKASTDPNFAPFLGIILVNANATGNGDLTVIDHLIVNGNRTNRMGGAAVKGCQSGEGKYGYNIGILDSLNVIFTNNVSKYGVCGTGLLFNTGENIIITNNTFAHNGVHNENMLWSDGLTIGNFKTAQVTNNTFFNNTDVDLIFGGCQNCIIQKNTITHDTTVNGFAWAGLMIQAWPGAMPVDLAGNYTGTDVSNNSIDCGSSKNCDFGLLIGGGPWYPVNVYKGYYHNNTVNNAVQGFEISDANNLTIANNIVTNSSNTFYCKVLANNYDISSHSSGINISDSSPVTYTHHGWPLGCQAR